MLSTDGGSSARAIYDNSAKQIATWIKNLEKEHHQSAHVRKLVDKLSAILFGKTNRRTQPTDSELDDYYTVLALEAELGHWLITKHLWGLCDNARKITRDMKRVSRALRLNSKSSKTTRHWQKSDDSYDFESIQKLSAALHKAKGRPLVCLGSSFDPVPIKFNEDHLATWFAFRIRAIMNLSFGSYGVLEVLFPLLQSIQPVKSKGDCRPSPQTWGSRLQPKKFDSSLQKLTMQQLKSAYPRLFK